MHKKTLLGMKLLATSLLLSGGIALSGNRAYATELDNEVVAVDEVAEELTSDAEKCYELSDGVLTLKGNVEDEQLNSLSESEMDSVETIIAAEGSVLPEDCSPLFWGFWNCSLIDLSKADASHVNDMSGMFEDLGKLTSLDISSFDTSNVSYTKDMFWHLTSLRVLKLGEGFKEVDENMGLPNGLVGWTVGSQEGERISGENEYAAIKNEGTNTYYRRVIKDGISEDTFPDETFRQYIREYIDEDKDGNLSEQEIANVTSISIPEEFCEISSLQGIEVFENLTELACSGWNLTTIDVSANKKLVTLVVSQNKLTEIDVSENRELTTLDVDSNNLKSLDVTTLSKLQVLSFGSNDITEIDLSGNPELVSLDCQGNLLTKLDMTINTKLQKLYCGGNEFTSMPQIDTLENLQELICCVCDIKSIDVSKNKKLVELDVCETKLTTLDVTMLPELQVLKVGTNDLQELDLSGNPELKWLYCSSNPMKELDLSSNHKLQHLQCPNNDFKSLNIMAAPLLVDVYRNTEPMRMGGMLIYCSNSDTFLEVSEDVKIIDRYFDDLKPDAWYEAAVNYVKEKGFMTGTSETTFKPDDTLTRSQFVKVIYNIEGMPEVEGENVFEDVAEGQWYTKAVIWAAGKKITSGISEKNFGTDLSITREQLATMLYRYASGKDLTYMHIEETAIASFPDADQIDTWAKEGMMWAVTNGIMNGKKGSGDKNYLDPKGTATRAECAQMIKNLKENLMK